MIYSCEEDFLYRQKGQLKLDNTVIEEFLPNLAFKAFPELNNVNFGPTKCFSAAYFKTSLQAVTNGGGLSFNHSGMYGMPLLIEGYRQLSGTAEDGVNGDSGKQTSARTCIINGTGGSLSTTGTLVLIADDD